MKSAFRGALIVIFTRWTDRLIGFLSMLILARLLAPDDFGIVSMAWVVIGLVDVLLDVGISVNLIQRQATDRDEYDSGWTIGIIQSFVTSSIVFLSAPLAAEYFRDPRVELLLRVLAPSLLIGALNNVGVVNFQKNMEFDKEFRFLFSRRVIGFVGTVSAAWVTGSYWGLVIGSYVNVVAGVILSYVFSSYRPKLCTTRVREMWSFSQWNLFRSIGNYLNTVIDRTILGRRLSAAAVGHYQLSYEIAAMPTTELLAPVGRALFPAFAGHQKEPILLRQKFLLALGLCVSIALPAGIGLAVVAPEAVTVLLGPQWLPAVGLLRILAIASAVTALAHTPGYLMLATARFRELTFVTWSQIGLFLILALAVFPFADASLIAYIRLAAVTASSALIIFLVTRYTPNITFRDFVSTTWRPLLSALLMASTVSAVNLFDGHAILSLAVKVAVGVITYPAFLLALWRVAGKPYGAEQYLLDKARAYFSLRFRTEQ